MSKPNIPNQKKQYDKLNKRLAKYALLVQKIYDALNLKAAKMAESVRFKDGEFRFVDYPELKKSIADLQIQFANDLQAVIFRGTSDEWKNSNEAQDLLVNKVLKAYTATIDKEKYKVYYEVNSDALKVFQNRKIKGLTVSDKLWIQSEGYKKELEDAISCAIEKGTSAVTLSKQISKYLHDFPSLKKDYKEKFGKAATSQDCEYKSIRLATSEINMAYRTAENERWNQMDFVVGYEIKLSGNHNCLGVPKGRFNDICDTLAGKYPKDFNWSGWHPMCRCYKIPILKTEEEFWAWDGREDVNTTSKNKVSDVPANYKLWIRNNEDRITNANSLPFFLKDNPNWKEYLSITYHRISDSKFDKFFKDVQKKILRQKYEVMTLMDKKGRILLETKGNSSNVFFSDEQAKIAKDAILVHNHPEGMMYNDFRRTGHSLSADDVFEAVDCDMFSMIAISPMYRYEMVRPVNGWKVSSNTIKSDYLDIYNKIRNLYQLKDSNRKYIVQHLIMKILSKKYGFEYKKTKIK